MKYFLWAVALSVSVFAEQYYDRGALVSLQPIPQPDRVRSSQTVSLRWFQSELGQIMGTSDKILVKWNSTAKVSALLESLNVTSFEWITASLMSVTVPEGSDIFVLSRILSELEETDFAHPDFHTERTLR